MTDRQPDLDKRVIRLPDGRRLIYYRFPEPAEPEDEAPVGTAPEEPPPGGQPEWRPRGEEP
jgi:hypothetical protein